MPDFWNALYQSLSPLWEMSVTAAYTATIIIVLRLLLKNRAPKQVFCLLWLVVFVRLLLPVSLESPLSIVPDALPGYEQVQPGGKAPNTPADHKPGQPQAPAQGNAQGQPIGTPVISSPGEPSLTIPGDVTPATPAPEPPVSFPWQAVAAGMWLAGALAMGGYGLFSYLRLRRRLFDAIRAKDGAWEHPDVDSPFILGMLRPRIYLPAGLVGQPRMFILCHERAHLRRLDHIIKPVCWVALALHWFNPLVWAAYILMSRDIESACDEAVIRRLGSEVKADYSTTLLALATGRRAPSPCPLAFDEGDAKGRIQNVLRYRRPALWVIVVSAVMAVLAAVCLLTDPVAAEAPEGGPAPDPSPDATISQAPESNLADTLLDPWMKEVLDGERQFISAYSQHSQGDGQAYGIHDLRTFYYGDDQFPDTVVEAGKLAVIDLDRDGINEMVIWPEGEDEYLYSVVGYLILRRQGDEIYGYNPAYRAFGLLKSDGTFHWSNSAFEHGTATLSFGPDDVVFQDTTYQKFAENGIDYLYFVDGQKATQEEYDAAVDVQNAKPDVTWYVYENGRLKYAPINVPIPLDEYAQAAPVPDFLDEEQQLLYRQAYTMYDHIFGPNTEEVDNWPGGGGYNGGDAVERNGWGYVPATGLYRNWNDFEEAVLSVFTPNYWQSRNYVLESGTTPGGAALYDPVYTNIDGQLHYVSAARGNRGNNTYFPETFRLVEQTENSISFVTTAYYREHPGDVPPEGWDAYLRAGWDYSLEFPIRMVKTEKGWRFDEFYCPMTDDNGRFQRIPNPDPPPLPSPSEPTATPEPVVVSELDGMRILSTADGYRLTWQGQSFPVGPDGVLDEYPGSDGWLEDFDEDGQPEALFYGREDGSYPFTIYDFVDNALVGYPLPDMETEVYLNISHASVAAYNPATGGLTMTFPWGEGESRRYITLHTTVSDDFFAGCEELADGRPLRMRVEPGSINGMGVPRGFAYRARISLTDGTTTSPEVGYMWFGILYSDSGFEIRMPKESDFSTDYSA